MATIDQARAAKQSLRRDMDRIAGVSGVGLTQRGDASDWVLQVNVQTVQVRKDVPPDVDGVPVTVHVVGAVEAL